MRTSIAYMDSLVINDASPLTPIIGTLFLSYGPLHLELGAATRYAQVRHEPLNTPYRHRTHPTPHTPSHLELGAAPPHAQVKHEPLDRPEVQVGSLQAGHKDDITGGLGSDVGVAVPVTTHPAAKPV